MANVNDLKIGTKIIDTYYSFHPKKDRCYGIGKVVQISKSKKFVYIKFSKQKDVIKYDKQHVEQFTLIYKKGMEKYPEGCVPLNHSSKTLKDALKRNLKKVINNYAHQLG